MKDRIVRKRTCQDKLICTFNSIRYALIEPLTLHIVRVLYEHQYDIDNPLISVYIPTYNRSPLLIKRAIPSVLAQTYENFELIIVGDHCTDDTEKQVLKIKDKRIRFYNLPYRTYRYPPTVENHWLAGPVVAANTALAMIKGKWIARCDDDDTWTKDHLAILLAYAKKGNFEFVSASYMTKRFGRKILVDVKDNIPRIGGTQTWLYRSYLKSFRYNIDCWRKKWNRVNDTDLQDRIYKAGVRIGYMEKVVAYVYPRPGEKTIGLDAYEKIKKKMIKHFKFKQ